MEGIGEALAVVDPTYRTILLGRQLDAVAYSQRWSTEANALRDLAFLALEAALHSLTRQDMTNKKAIHLLSHTYARHAQYLSEQAAGGKHQRRRSGH
jgi:hypothetical protein